MLYRALINQRSIDSRSNEIKIEGNILAFKNGLIASYPSLLENISCEVLIIGGGITGSLMAYKLSKEGYKTVLIDKRDIAMGSTSATTAMLQYEIDEPLYSLIEKVGENAAVDSYRQGVVAIEQLRKIIEHTKADCGFKKKQSLYVAHSKKDMEWLELEFKTRKKFNFDVRWLTQAQLKKQYSMVGEGGILSQSGASMDAYSLSHALLSFSIKHYGLRVFDHTCAETIEHSEKINTVTTDASSIIKCKKIVFTTGYEIQNNISKKIVKLISTYAFVSEPLDRIPLSLSNTLFWNTQDPYLYMRTTADNRILVGGGDEEFKNSIRRDRLINKKEAFLVESIKEFLPELKLIPDFSWAGTFGVTQDALPFIGAHENYPNSYFVLGYGGNGITFSVMGISIISDALSGKHNKFLEYYSFDRKS